MSFLDSFLPPLFFYFCNSDQRKKHTCFIQMSCECDFSLNMSTVCSCPEHVWIPPWTIPAVSVSKPQKINIQRADLYKNRIHQPRPLFLHECHTFAQTCQLECHQETSGFFAVWLISSSMPLVQPQARNNVVQKGTITHSCWNVMKWCRRILAPRSHGGPERWAMLLCLPFPDCRFW